MTRLPLVLDTNVIVSGLLFTGTPHKILNAALLGRLKLITSAALLDELERVLKDKFSNTEIEVTQMLEIITKAAVISIPAETIEIIENDPSDNRVLECASSGKAEVIVSGDKHLLKLKKFRDTFILSPREFLKYWKDYSAGSTPV